MSGGWQQHDDGGHSGFERLVMGLAVGFVNTPLDELDEAIGRALADTGHYTGVDRAYLFAYDFEAGITRNTHEWCAPGVEPVIDELQAVPLDEIPEWVQTHLHGETMHIPSVAALHEREPLRRLLEPQGVETLVTVPLLTGERCLGFVGFDVVGTGKCWSEHERDLLKVLAELFTNAQVRREREREMLAAREDAERAEERLALALSATRDAIWDHDLRAGTVRLSDRWWQMLGDTDRPTVGDVHTVDALLHPEDRGAVRRSYRAAIEGTSDTFELRFRLRHRDGHDVPVLCRARILRDGEGRALRLVGSNLDVTQQRRHERALVEAKQAAEAASEAKTRFISTVSHELRTPMTGVLGMVDLLLREELADRPREYARSAQRSARSLLGLLDDLLDIAKIEAGRLELAEHPVRLRELVDDVCGLVEPAAGDKGVAVGARVAPEVPQQVGADGVRLRQVLLNLLGNAVKFTDEGRVDVGVDVVGHPDRDHLDVRIAVEDTGVGIPSDVLPRLFAPFTQADDTTTRRFGGTGLGLAIVRQLVELMGGTVSVDSVPGRGSVFEVCVPLATVRDDEPSLPVPRGAGSRPDADLAGRHVLVVEDHPVNQSLVRAYLEDLGASVTVVEDGEHGASAALAAGVDAVLMDCFMPGVDGFEATRRIRAGESPERRVPVVALTADASAGHARVCRSAGMDEVLTKPYGQAELADVLRRCLAARSGTGGMRAS